MDKLTLIALLEALNSVNEEELEQISSLRGPRGFKGDPGEPGKDFSFEENKAEIHSILRERFDKDKNKFKLKFSDLSKEEKESLKLKFKDLSPKDIKQLKGKDGKPGRSFDFEAEKENITESLYQIFKSKKEELKLKFKDLSEDEIQQIKGEKGRPGKDGKSFIFEDHEDEISKNITDYINSIADNLKLKFDDLTRIEKNQLSLKYKDLTEDQKEKLKLKFEDLSEEERRSLKGSRGQRGKPGEQGERGEKGDPGKDGKAGAKGETGKQGPRGIPGLTGLSGINGKDGKNAPVIEDIKVKRENTNMYFIFIMSDGSEIKTNKVKLPEINTVLNRIISGGGGGGAGTLIVSKDDTEVGETAIINFEGPNINVTYDSGTKKATVTVDETPEKCIPVSDNGTVITDCLNSINFCGDLIQATTQTVMEDWPTLAEIVPSIASYEATNPGQVDVCIDDPFVFRNETCEASVYVGAAVYVDGGVIKNCLADNEATSNFIGFCVAKAASTICDVRFGGKTENIFTGLDETEDYYLSDTVPGAIVKAPNIPILTGHIKLKIGQPFGSDKIVIMKGEKVIRG